jgi:hypothetical protein
MELCTSVLPRETLLAEIARLPDHLKALGITKVILKYGWGSGLHEDLWYQPMRDSTDYLRTFFEDSIKQNIYLPGGSDLLISDEAKTLEVRLCHESDIHIQSDQKEVLDYFATVWSATRHYIKQ